jgi:hypothetical protein
MSAVLARFVPNDEVRATSADQLHPSQRERGQRSGRLGGVRDRCQAGSPRFPDSRLTRPPTPPFFVDP